jgi:NitT/TauT family transport system ATP-binding protein
MTTPPPEIAIRDLEVTYSALGASVRALGPLPRLDIARGQVVAIVGPSGCGKTTLAKTIAGLIRPSAGRVEVTPRDASRAPVIATVFQDYAIFPWKTVLDNVAFGLVIGGMGRDDAMRRSLRWVERLGLSGFEGAYPSMLSGGMQQRVGIARALAVEPDILIMDEPFASLDAQLREIMQEELLSLQQETNSTVLLITHSLEEALVLSDRVIVLTARPGTVLLSEDLPFGRPRDSSVRETAEFAALRMRLWSHLRTEVLDQLSPRPLAAGDG